MRGGAAVYPAALVRRPAAKRKNPGPGRSLYSRPKILRKLPGALIKDREEFERLFDAAVKKACLKLPAPARKAVITALSERDETAAICRDKDGSPEPDSELRDTESVPLPVGEDSVDVDDVPTSVRSFFAREVLPHVPDAWIDTAKRDQKDGKVGLVGYEINFNLS